MCCFAEFVVKYVLIIANIVFAIAGIVVAGLGIAVLVNLNQIDDVVPTGLTFMPILVITLGCVVFALAFLACCGAMTESRCMLIFYAIFMSILAAAKIYLTVVIFQFLKAALSRVSKWLTSGFANPDIRPGFPALENLFKCCGTTGADAYVNMGLIIPQSCCGNPETSQCTVQTSYGGCINAITDYFETFGEAIGWILIIVIIIELVCVLFGSFLSCQIQRKRNYA